MMHKALRDIEEVPYYFSRSSIKFQGHTGWKIFDLNQIWVRLIGRSQLSNLSDLPCFYIKEVCRGMSFPISRKYRTHLMYLKATTFHHWMESLYVYLGILIHWFTQYFNPCHTCRMFLHVIEMSMYILNFYAYTVLREFCTNYGFVLYCWIKLSMLSYTDMGIGHLFIVITCYVII